MNYFRCAFWFTAIVCTATVLYFSIPNLLTDFFYEKEKKTFFYKVKASLKEITAGENYCLVTPKFYKDGLLWVVDNDPGNIELREIISNTIRYKLIVYSQFVGPSIKRRLQLGRKMHFGVLVGDSFYHWSFRENSFIHAPNAGEAWVKKLKKMYAERLAVDGFPIQIKQDLKLKYPNLTPESAYCPHLHH